MGRSYYYCVSRIKLSRPRPRPCRAACKGHFSPFRTLNEYRRVAQACGAPLPGDLGWMYERAAAIEAALRQGTEILRYGIIDWEYAGMGDICFDLANFAIHYNTSDAQDEALLRVYFGAAS